MKYQHSMMLGQSSCPKYDALKMAQAEREGEREHMEDNNKAKPEQLMLPTSQPTTVDS
jgi:hypothetical protein